MKAAAMEGMIFFFKKGLDIMGIDISKTAIRNNKKIKKNFLFERYLFKKILFKRKGSIIYARFFLNAIDSLSIP
jgi:hypothetical protein